MTCFTPLAGASLGMLLVTLTLPAGCGSPPSGPGLGAEADYERGFQARAAFYLRQTAARDTDAMVEGFESSSYFRNAGGDAHKYAMPPVLAKVALDPRDAVALRAYRYLQNVAEKKSDRALYHFATFQRARLYFQFKDVLPEWVVKSNEDDARRFFRVMLGNPNSQTHGTDNHATMHRLTGLLWAERFGGKDLGSEFHDRYVFLRDWARGQLTKYYTVGQGEYDSSSYVGYTCASWANLYDFSPDPETRLMAKAALDWLAASMARKWFHGLLLGPESRGFTHQPVGASTQPAGSRAGGPLKVGYHGSGTDWAAWLWWGDTAGRLDLSRTDQEVSLGPAINLALSAYRPHPVIRALAAKRVSLPYSDLGSKPTYYGLGDNKDQETLYFDRDFALGVLHCGDDGIASTGTILPQTTMFKLALRDPRVGVSVFGMNQGYHKHYPLEGRSPFDQYHQATSAAILISHTPEDQAAAIRQRIEANKWPAANLEPRSILGVPRHLPDPVRAQGWYLWQVGQVLVAARPLNGQAAFADLPEREKQKDKDVHRWLVSPGRLTGWLVQVAPAPPSEAAAPDPRRPFVTDLQRFAGTLQAEARLDLSRFESDREVTYRGLDGTRMKVRHTGTAGGKPEAWINDAKLDYRGWPVFASPHMKQAVGRGVLEVNDGRTRLTIDVNGPSPRYTETPLP